MAQSALSQIVRRIEERLGLRLLTRTSRVALYQLKRASIFYLFLAQCYMT
ncbi:LysR family transcriptional regulator [Escherichia coli]